MTSPTCQGNSPLTAISPPTILLVLFVVLTLLTPHLQSPTSGGFVGAGGVSQLGGRHPWARPRQQMMKRKVSIIVKDSKLPVCIVPSVYILL